MNALLPIIEQLADAPDDAARARWLLACPIHVLVKYQETIINRLRNRFFADGVAYVEAELVLLKQVRALGLPTRDNPLRLLMVATSGLTDVAGPTEVAQAATEI